MIETKNAKIVGTTLGTEHHTFSFMLDLEYDGGGSQRAGGICLIDKTGSICGRMISRIMEVVGVMTWEELPGQPIRVKAERAKVRAIGHYLDDKWINFADLAECLTTTKAAAPEDKSWKCCCDECGYRWQSFIEGKICPTCGSQEIRCEK